MVHPQSRYSRVHLWYLRTTICVDELDPERPCFSDSELFSATQSSPPISLYRWRKILADALDLAIPQQWMLKLIFRREIEECNAIRARNRVMQ